MRMHSVYLGRLHMKEVKIYIVEEDTGRVSINMDWGDWNTGTYKEKLMAVAMQEPMTHMLKTLPIGKMVAHAQADTAEEARRICGLIADVTEAEMEDDDES